MLGIILVATLVTAQVVINLNLTDAIFTPEQRGIPTLNAGNVTFDCGKTSMNVYVSSGDLKIDDDFEQVINGVCTEEITNVVDWNNRDYQQNQYGLRSFDEDILRKDVCNQNEQNYNITSKECYKIETDEVILG